MIAQTVQTRMNAKWEITRLADCVRRGGPEPFEYAAIADCFRALGTNDDDTDKVAAVFAPTLTADCIHGHGYLQPRGYAGDFEMIDRIYTGWVSHNPRLARWDRFFHAQAAPRAVRNRKLFLQRTLGELDERNPTGTANVLNVGSGPGRDVAEYFASRPDSNLRVLSLDLDPNAIRHAEDLCRPYQNRVRFACENVVRYSSTSQFDLVWSAGLFDYFSDRLFVRVARRLFESVRPGGELVIGNFGPDNPSRAYMELLGRWELKHRSASQLLALASEAGATDGQARVEWEPEGINLFLRVSKPAATVIA